MLLNTLCDVFGSFIMIALILVLPSGIKQIVKPVPDEETLERRIDAAQAELAAIDARIVKITPDSSVLSAEIEKRRLETSIASLKEREQALDSTRSKEISEASRDVAKEDHDLQIQIQQAKLETESTKNALAAASNLLTQLGPRKDAINVAISAAKQARVQQMRLPRERETSKGPVSVIFRYGRVYPLQSSLDPLTRNTDSLQWVPTSDDSDKVIPIEGKGLSANEESAILSWAQQMPADGFVACYVYVDSIEAFRAFRKIVQSKNIDLGWEPVESGRTLNFGSGGSSPRPQ